jgi:hypothetical protein
VAEQGINAETVTSLLGNVRELLRDEDQRASGLNTRGSGLAGFAGIILALTGVAAKTGGSLHGTLRDAVAAMAAAALVFLVLAVLVATFGVLLPTSGTSIAMSEVRRYPTYEFISQPRVMIEGATLRGLIRALDRERARNHVKAIWLRVAYGFLGLGLLLVAGLGVTLAATGHFYG